MQDPRSNDRRHYLHHLEESVLSLATGNLEPVQKPVPQVETHPPRDKDQQHEGEEELKLVPEFMGKQPVQPEETGPASLQKKLSSISRSVNECIQFVGRNVLGRQEIIKQSFLALMTGEHQLLISRTGMAKSLLARQIFICFDGATTFEKQLTKDTMPENLFGSYDIEAMKKGKMIHNVEGSLVLSHFAFLDEIFDANDMLLRSLLSLLNEKQLVNGEQIVHSTLHSAIAAANYIRMTEILEAVLDRFLYKSFIPENKDLYFEYSIDQIYQQQFGKVAVPEKRLTLGELSYIKKLIQSKRIDIPGYVLFLKNYILKKYVEETRNMVSDRKEFTISDRTLVKTQDTLRACAILEGREQVEEKDLDNLYYVVCALGREDDKARLTKVTGTAKNYFRQDRDTIDNILNAIGILNILKANGNDEVLKTDKTFNQVRDGLEKVTRSGGSILKEYFNKLKNKLMALTQDSFVPETFSILESLCEVSLKNAKTKEAREIIIGFQEDLFNAKKIVQL